MSAFLLYVSGVGSRRPPSLNPKGLHPLAPTRITRRVLEIFVENPGFYPILHADLLRGS